MVKKTKSLKHGHRFPAVVISCAVRWYFRFSLSLRDVEELLHERGVVVTYETIRCWCDKFGAEFARCAKAARPRPGSIWHLEAAQIKLGADKGYDADEFIEACQPMKVTPHVAPNTSGRRSAVPDEIARSVGYAISQQKRKLIEQGFGWAETVGRMRQVMVQAENCAAVVAQSEGPCFRRAVFSAAC